MDLKNILASLKKKKYEPSENKLGYSFVPLSHFEGYKLKLKARNIIVVVDGSGNVIDIFPKDQKDDMRDVYTQKLAENTEQDSLRQIKIEKENQRIKDEEKEIAKRSVELNVNRKENIKLLNAMKNDSEKIEDRYMNAEHRYLTVKQKLEELTADLDPLDPAYEKDFKELQSTAEYKRLANLEIQALKRFFKVSNALSGLSEELALTNPEYQAIDYNKKVQDIVTEPTGFFERIAGKPRRIPEGDPGSIDRNRIRDYKSGELSPSQELERRGKAIERGKETIERGGNMWEAGKVAMETKLPEPEKTPYDTFSTDQLIELLIKENQKKK